MAKKAKFVFFGTPQIAVDVLDALKDEDLLPELVVTGEDKERGRGLEISAPPAKVWASEHKIPFLQPKTLSDEEFLKEIKKLDSDFFLVAAYAKLIPKEVFDMPPHGTLNIHPSLLPRLRGPSPIKTAIMQEDETGVTIMKLDEKMDHGPIVAQKSVDIEPWPQKSSAVEKILACEGAKLLAEVLPNYLDGKLVPTPQNHDGATYSKKISRADGQIDLQENSITNLRKVLAYGENPGAYFFTEHPKGSGKMIRVKIRDAHMENGALAIDRVVPEGRKEMSWDEFRRGFSL